MTAHICSAQPATQRCHRWLYFYFPWLFNLISTTQRNLKTVLENYFQSIAVIFLLKVIFHLNTSSEKISVHVFLQITVICLEMWLREVLLIKMLVNHAKIVHVFCSSCAFSTPDVWMWGGFFDFFFFLVYCFTEVVNNPSAQSVQFSLYLS